jgi:hypothetical protein
MWKRARLRTLADEIERWKDVTLSTGFPAAAEAA